MKPTRLTEELFKLGVTSVREKWHSLYTCELILEGEFNNDDIHECLYKYSKACSHMVGDIVINKKYHNTYYKAGFSRK